jgi:hypothetical protein
MRIPAIIRRSHTSPLFEFALKKPVMAEPNVRSHSGQCYLRIFLQALAGFSNPPLQEILLDADLHVAFENMRQVAL